MIGVVMAVLSWPASPREVSGWPGEYATIIGTFPASLLLAELFPSLVHQAVAWQLHLASFALNGVLVASVVTLALRWYVTCVARKNRGA
jgi:hypothetical protein